WSSVTRSSRNTNCLYTQNNASPSKIYTLSLHDALPIFIKGPTTSPYYWNRADRTRETMLGEWLRTGDMFARDADGYFRFAGRGEDRKSTRLNSSHSQISYAVFCLKKKKTTYNP